MQLSDPRPPNPRHDVEYVRVNLQGRQLPNCSSDIYLYEALPLVQFFEEMANHWQGWDRDKEWSSIEGDFSLTATSDRLGHISLQVELHSGPDPDDWTVNAIIALEAGQLAAIAANVKEFLQGDK